VRAVSAKELEQAQIRSHRTYASQEAHKVRKRSAGQLGASYGAAKRIKTEYGVGCSARGNVSVMQEDGNHMSQS